MSRRDQIKMSQEEIDEFLQGRHVMNIATIGKDGRPHLVAMWYGFLDGDLAFWTYGKSQKILNLQRDSRITCLVEDGDQYDQLRGVEIVGSGIIVDDRDKIMAIGANLFERYQGPLFEGAREALKQSGAKRLGVKIKVEKMVTWDHRKLGG